MGYHELQPLHGSQPALEGFSCLEDGIKSLIVESLSSEGGIVGSGVEEM